MSLPLQRLHFSLHIPFSTFSFFLLTCFYCLNMLVTKHDHVKDGEFYVLNPRGQLKLSKTSSKFSEAKFQITWVRGPPLVQWTLAKPMLIGGFSNGKTFWKWLSQIALVNVSWCSHFTVGIVCSILWLYDSFSHGKGWNGNTNICFCGFSVSPLL